MGDAFVNELISEIVLNLGLIEDCADKANSHWIIRNPVLARILGRDELGESAGPRWRVSFDN